MKSSDINWNRHIGSNLITILVFLVFFAVGPVSALNVFLDLNSDNVNDWSYWNRKYNVMHTLINYFLQLNLINRVSFFSF